MFEAVRWFVSRHPGLVVGIWLVLAVGIFWRAPSLTQLAAEQRAELLPPGSESKLGTTFLQEGWPDQWAQTQVVLALQRRGGLTEADEAFALALTEQLSDPNRPPELLRVLGPDARPEIAERLRSPDGEMQLIIAAVDDSMVSPGTQNLVRWMEDQATKLKSIHPDGLVIGWTGDAVLGRDYMDNVQESLNRAGVVTVFLLTTVLLAVYRSFWLAMVPLLTIGTGLIVARGVLAWMALLGWELSPLVELFLLVILFGCGTDYCLFITWRFSELWNAANLPGAIRTTLGRVSGTLLTSAGTTILGLSLMGTTRFKLFSSTGPSVAIGLALILVASLTLTPALLLLLARWRPKAYAGMTAPSVGLWDALGRKVLARPWVAWIGTVLVMLPAALLGFSLTIQNMFIEDTISGLPSDTPSIQTMHAVSEKFGTGVIAPLTVVLEAEGDLRSSEGLALIDDISRLMTHQRLLTEVRSATQPLGSPEPLRPARLADRLQAVNEGFEQLVAGARQLEAGLIEGGGRLRTAIMLEDLTGFSITGRALPPSELENDAPPPEQPRRSSGDPLSGGLRQATSALLGQIPGMGVASAVTPIAPVEGDSPQARMLQELSEAARGAGQIAEGAERARHEIVTILNDPVGRRALDRLLITAETIREFPELLDSFEAYISADSHLARIDLVSSLPPITPESVEQVRVLRQRLHDYLSELDDESSLSPRAYLTGVNAAALDNQNLVRRDQYQTWIIVPLGVLIVLIIALRDPVTCMNLVGTMLLTYCFALGITQLVFVHGFGADGIDWKVPYFLFVLLIAVGVDFNVFLMTRLLEEAKTLGLHGGISRAISQTGGLISSAAAITACSFAALMTSPLASLRQLGFALVVGITIDAVLVRPLLVPCGHWLLNRRRERRRQSAAKRSHRSELSRTAVSTQGSMN